MVCQLNAEPYKLQKLEIVFTVQIFFTVSVQVKNHFSVLTAVPLITKIGSRDYS